MRTTNRGCILSLALSLCTIHYWSLLLINPHHGLRDLLASKDNGPCCCCCYSADIAQCAGGEEIKKQLQQQYMYNINDALARFPKEQGGAPLPRGQQISCHKGDEPYTVDQNLPGCFFNTASVLPLPYSNVLFCRSRSFPNLLLSFLHFSFLSPRYLHTSSPVFKLSFGPRAPASAFAGGPLLSYGSREISPVRCCKMAEGTGPKKMGEVGMLENCGVGRGALSPEYCKTVGDVARNILMFYFFNAVFKDPLASRGPSFWPETRVARKKPELFAQ